MARNIFIEKNLHCPACKSNILLKYPNPKLYAAAARDEDQRITAYSWSGGIQTDVLPHYYAVFQCPDCLLADLRENFETAGHGLKESKLYDSLPQAPFEKRMVLRKLHRFVPKEEIDAQGALALHLAAIFTTLLPGEEELIDHLKLGRIYLRLSWLYREENEQKGLTHAAGETDTDTASTPGKLLLIIEQFQQIIQQVFSENLESIQQLTEIRANELKIPLDQTPYAKLLALTREKMGQMQQTAAMFQQVAAQDKKGMLIESALTASGEANNLEQVLPSLLPQWPQLPRTEKEAVRLAVDAFDYSSRFEDTDQTIQQSMGLVNLIIKLLLKINDLERALDYVLQIFKTGYRDKQELQMKLNQGKRNKTLSDVEERGLTKQIGSINRTLTMAAENRRKIVGFIFERDKEKILSILNEKAEVSPEEQEQALIEAGLSEELIPWLRENDLVKSEETKKKWFGKK
jgi:hypothetical protein